MRPESVFSCIGWLASAALVTGLLGGCASDRGGKWPRAVPQGPTGEIDLSRNLPLAELAPPLAGKGTVARGLYNWEGEIVGLPAPGGEFARLIIGMRPHEVTELLGPPTDHGFYETAMSQPLSPYLFGSDDSRWEMIYPGQGRLIFATQETLGTGRFLTRIIHDPAVAPLR